MAKFEKNFSAEYTNLKTKSIIVFILEAVERVYEVVLCKNRLNTTYYSRIV